MGHVVLKGGPTNIVAHVLVKGKHIRRIVQYRKGSFPPRDCFSTSRSFDFQKTASCCPLAMPIWANVSGVSDLMVPTKWRDTRAEVTTVPRNAVLFLCSLWGRKTSPEVLPVFLDFLHTQRTCEDNTIFNVFSTRKKKSKENVWNMWILLCSVVSHRCRWLFKEFGDIWDHMVAQRVLRYEKKPYQEGPDIGKHWASPVLSVAPCHPADTFQVSFWPYSAPSREIWQCWPVLFFGFCGIYHRNSHWDGSVQQRGWFRSMRTMATLKCANVWSDLVFPVSHRHVHHFRLNLYFYYFLDSNSLDWPRIRSENYSSFVKKQNLMKTADQINDRARHLQQLLRNVRKIGAATPKQSGFDFIKDSFSLHNFSRALEFKSLGTKNKKNPQFVRTQTGYKPDNYFTSVICFLL